MDILEQDNLLPLYFAPPVNWYSSFIQHDVLRIADEQVFSKQTLRNRCSYGTFQGKKSFSIPLSHNSLGRAYREIAINYSENWQNQFIHALQTSYGKSPFFEFYGYRFEDLIRNKFEYLWDLNKAILEETLNCMKLEIPVQTIFTDKIKDPEPPAIEPYYQVFGERQPFMPDLSILDLLYNEGPDTLEILQRGNKLHAL